MMKRACQYIFFVAVWSLLACGYSFAQATLSQGTEFWIGFMDNWLQNPQNPIKLELHVVAEEATSGKLVIPKLPQWSGVEFTVDAGASKVLNVPASFAMAFGSGLVQPKGIYVTTDKPVHLYAMNRRQFSADMTLVLPINALGGDYLVMTHREPSDRGINEHSDSELVVVSPADGTVVEITPAAATINGNPAGQPFTITLNRGQLYQLQAAGDLTGSRVRSVAVGCQPLAVFAGNRHTRVGSCNHADGNDHLFSQMYPIESWGTDYITVPFRSQLTADLIKVLAAEDNTVVSFNDSTFTLNRGEFAAVVEKDVAAIRASKPVSVAQFSLSQGCDGITGDPFMMMISPNGLLLPGIVVNPPSLPGLREPQLTIISPATGVAGVTLDNQNIASHFEPVPAMPGFSYASLVIPKGMQYLRSETSGLLAYVYGYGNNDSFGYPVAIAMPEERLFDFYVVDESGLAVDLDNVCPGVSLYMELSESGLFDTYLWSFGDGQFTEATADTPVTHVYTEQGTYQITLTASNDGGGCINNRQQIVDKQVRVWAPDVALSGPVSLCQSSGYAIYRVFNPDQANLEWKIEGGTIEAYYGDSVAVEWTAQHGKVVVVAVGESGCVGKEHEMGVQVSQLLKPGVPLGPDSLCAFYASSIVYEADFVAGAQYEWSIENGEIIDGQGTYRVTVDWEGAGSLWYEQQNPGNECRGLSGVLVVVVEQAPEPGGEISSSPDPLERGQVKHFQVIADPLYSMADWDFGDGHSLEGVPVREEVSHLYACDGVFNVKAVVYNKELLCDSQEELETEIEIEPPQLELLRVSHSETADNSLLIEWEGGNLPGVTKYLYRRDHLPAEGPWKLITALPARDYEYVDWREVNTAAKSYSYRIDLEDYCPTVFSTSVHESIRLTAERSDQEYSLWWNEYVGWQFGVKTYEVWLKKDDGDFELYDEYATPGMIVDYAEDGFSYCFRVLAAEEDRHGSSSLSNQTCLSFVPRVVPYNVFTPNGDGYNEFFHIQGVELYTNSFLTVFDRSGKTVYTRKGYRNDWSGGNLPSGLYYYLLELNEPRATTPTIRGEVSILR